MHKFLLIGFLMIGGVYAHADTPDIDWSTFWRLESGKLLDPGIMVHRDPVVKINVRATVADGTFRGVYADTFHSTGLGGCLEDESCAPQEWDLHLGWSGTLDQLFSSASSDAFALVQVSHFLLGHVNEQEGDVSQLKLRLQWRGWGVQPFIETNYQYLHVDGGSGGLLSHAGLQWPVHISDRWGLTLSVDGTYDGVPFRDNGWLARGGLTLTYQVIPSTTLWANGFGTAPITKFNDRDPEAIWGLGFKMDL